jgi:hypothetical protein
MLSKLSRLIRRRNDKKPSHYTRTVRASGQRRAAPTLELLDRRDLPSSVISSGSSYTIENINNESIKIVAVAGVGFVPYHDNQPYYTNDSLQTQVEFTAGLPIYLSAGGGVNTLTVDDRQGAAGNGYLVTSDQYGDQQLILGPTVTGANNSRSVAEDETITLTTPNITNRLLYVGQSSTANNYVQITDNAADGGTLGTLSACSGWDINGGGTTELLLDDHASTGAGTYNITNNQVYFQSRFFGGPQLVCTYGSVSTMDLLTSEPRNAFGVDTVGGNTVNVQSTSAGTTTTIVGNGEGTTYNIGNGTLDNLPGSVIVRSNIYGNVIVNDGAATSQPTYDIEGSSLTRPGFGSLSFNITSNTAVQNLTLDGPASATYDVRSDSAATTLDSGPGNNTFNIADGHLSTLLKKVTVNAAGGGVNTLVVNDSTDPATGAFSIMPGFITRPGLAGVSYSSNLQSVTVNSGFVGNQAFLVGNGDLGQTFGGAVFTINASGPNNSVILDDHLAGLFQGPYVITSNEVARAGAYFNYSGVQYLTLQGSNNDTDYLVASRSAFTTLSIGAGDLSALTGVTLNGQFDGLKLDDHLSAFQGAYTITGTSVTRNGFVGLNYANHALTQFTLDGANNGNTYLVDSTSLPTTINSGGANSSFSISNDYTLDQFAGRVTINGKGVNNAVDLEDFDDSFHGSYTITSSSVDRPGFAGLTYSNVQVLGLTGSQGSDVYNVTGTSAKTILYGLAGSNTIDIGGGSLNGLTGAVVVYGLGGSNSIVVDDHLASGNEAYNVSSTSVTRPGFGGLTYSGVQSLTLDGDSSGNDTVNIGGGNLGGLGTVAVGNSGATAATSADPMAPVNVNINLGSGRNSLIVDDHLVNVNNTYTITSTSVTRNGFGGLTYADVQSITVDGANDGSDYSVNSTSVATTLNSGGDNSNFIIGGAGTLDPITSPVTVNGNGVNNTVALDDEAANFQGIYAITSNGVSRTSFAWLAGGHAPLAALLNCNNVRSLDLTGSAGGDKFNVSGTSAQTILDARGGSSTFDVATGNLGLLAGQVTVHGYGDSNSLVVNDQQSSGSNAYTIAAGTIRRQGFGGLSFDGVQNATLELASSGANALTLGNGDIGDLIACQLNGASSSNSVAFQAATGSAPVTIIGTVNNAVLDDHLANFAGIYTVTPGTVTRNGFGGLTYSNLQGLAIDCSAGSTIDVTGTSAPITINSGGGDSINLGAGDLGAVQGAVTVNGSGGSDVVVLDDHGSTFAGAYTLTSSSVNRAGFGGLDFTNAAIGLIGSINADGYKVASSSGAVFIQAGGNGNSFNIGDGSFNNVQGVVTINCTGSGNAVTVNDQNSYSNNNYTITSNSVAKNGFAALNYQGVQSLTVNGGSGGGAIFTVTGTSVPTTLNSGGSNNSTFNVGNGNLDSLAAPLLVTSGGTHGALDVDDTMTTAGQTYTITAGQVSRPGAAAINYSGSFVRVELYAGNHGNTIDVQGTNAVYTLIQPGATGDAVDLSSSSHSVDGIGGVLVQDPCFASTVTVDDSGHTVGDTYDVTNESVSVGRSSSFFFGYTGSQGGGGNGQSGIAGLKLVTSPGTGNSVNIASTSVPTTISGAVGSSILLGAGDLSPLMAPVTISGGSASDSVSLDDHSATFQGAYTILPNAVSRVGFGGLTYNGVNNLTLAGSKSNDVYNVQGAVTNTHLHLGNGILASSNYGASNSAISDGELFVTGSLTDPGGLSVASGAVLTGTGSVVGPVSVAGILAPGSGGLGQLGTGNLNLASGASFIVSQDGSSYTQANVTGAVNLGGASLSLPSNFAVGAGGQALLLSNDGSDPVIGTFAGLAEGSTVRADGHAFTISYKGGDGNDVVLSQVEPPTVAGIQVNDGSAQRSEVWSITVTFSGSVTFAGGNANAAAAFQLTHLTDSTNVALNAAVSANSQGETVVTLTFAGSETDAVSSRNGGVASLADGRYQLTIFSASVSGSAGTTLAGGGPNGNYVSPTDNFGGTGLHLFRLFADVNGDGVVDPSDLNLFRSAFNTNSSQASYISYLDADNSGAIDPTDLNQFRTRFNTNVFG